MAKSGLSLEPIIVQPGVQPITDSTSVSTKHYTYADKIRFDNGIPYKIGGWESQDFDYGEEIEGTTRSIFTDFIDGRYYVILGTNERLYSITGSRLTNITPFETTSIAIANSLATQYGTLANNPFSSTNGSSVITVTDADTARFQAGDTVTFSGATGFAGILAGSLNGDHIVRSVSIGSYTINVGTNANATTSGGGAGVVRASGLIQVTDAAHGQADGDRVMLSGAANTGGILAADINKEFIIRNVATNTFDIMTEGTATSSVSSAGGGATIYYQQIPAGAVDESNFQGYGAGLYGLGLYGTALVSVSARGYPRIWFIDRYANTIIATPGNQTGIYQWFGDEEVGPILVANAPTAVNYAFISDNILVTLGAGGVENRVFASDQNDIEMWTSSSTNQVFDDDIEGAGKLISHCPIDDYNLLFTEYETYSFRYIGLPFVWEIKTIATSVGLIAPMARVSVNGIAFWMGQDNFYMYKGGVVETIRANTQNESTLRRYVFGDLNYGQKSKCFAWYNKVYNEIWFHYPSANSNEPDRVAVVNILDFTWTPHTFDRTAAESPSVKTNNPYLANVSTLYKHEIGLNDDGAGMDWTLTSNNRFYGKDSATINSIVPDSNQTGTIQFTDLAKLYPQSSSAIYNKTTPVTTTTEYIPTLSSARFHQYTWSGNELDQQFEMGQWFEEVQRSWPAK